MHRTIQSELFVVVQSLSHIWLCDSMDGRMPVFPILRYLQEFAQTHVHWVSDAIQPSYPLSPPFPPAPRLAQHQSFSPMSELFTSGVQSIGASASVLLINIQLRLKLQYFSYLMQKANSLEKTLMLGTIEAGGERAIEDGMVVWHHWLNGHEFEQTPADSEGQGSLACCSPWGCKEWDRTEWLDWTELNCSLLALC